MINTIFYWVFGIVLIPFILWRLSIHMKGVVKKTIFIKYKLDEKKYIEHTDSRIFGHELIFLSMAIYLAGAKIFYRALDIIAVFDEVVKGFLFFTGFTVYIYFYYLTHNKIGKLDRNKESDNFVPIIPFQKKGLFKIKLNTYLALCISLLGILVYTITIFLLLYTISLSF